MERNPRGGAAAIDELIEESERTVQREAELTQTSRNDPGFGPLRT
jgi:hypothetical protein